MQCWLEVSEMGEEQTIKKNRERERKREREMEKANNGKPLINSGIPIEDLPL